MKKLLTNVMLILMLTSMILLTTSCATVFGGRVSDCQRTRPAAGQPTRQIRAVALIADILLMPVGAIVDFLTGAIYKPCEIKK